MKKILVILLLCLNVFATNLDEDNIKKQIGNMLVVGFDESFITKNSQIVKDIKKYNLAGVILFDKFYKNKSKAKNIISPTQLKELTKKLQHFSKKRLLITIDEEGGNVQRLKAKDGFISTPSAKAIAKIGENEAKINYENLAKSLKDLGINTNFAPVVDLALNPKNKVIVQLNRAYSKDVQTTLKYAKILMQEQKKQNIISVLKHFPGHGSSLKDSHKGFVDITKTWNKKELEPYKQLIVQNSVDMIMTAHVFNKNLDKKYPASLSYNINTKLLREKLNFSGVLISDDLQMKAISQHYKLNEVVRLAINSGVDLLLFGNQLLNYKTQDIINTIYDEIKKGNISLEKIKLANKRVNKLLHTSL